MDRNSDIARLGLRPREAAVALGISERTLWRLTKEGHIPCVRLGTGKHRRVVFPTDMLAEWLRKQAQGGK
jgi:excisionase family DNA binding protein